MLAVLFGRLAVGERHRGQRMGGRLLLDALRRAADVPVAVKLVIVDALNDAAAAFYEHCGFRRISDDPRRLFLTMAHVRTLFPARGSLRGASDRRAAARQCGGTAR